MKILLVEDNKTIAKGVAYSLEAGGCEVTICGTCEEVFAQLCNDFSVAIIDIGLPDGNGFELYKDVKRLLGCYVIFLTALDDEDSVVKGLELGADDYITKPFSTRELVARVNRLIRNGKDKSPCITVGNITYDSDSKLVFRDGERLEFTALEQRIFSMLMQNLGKTVTRDSILEKIWDIAGNYVNDNTLTVYIKRIRQKLGTDIIKTVKGIGYRIDKQ